MKAGFFEGGAAVVELADGAVGLLFGLPKDMDIGLDMMARREGMVFRGVSLYYTPRLWAAKRRGFLGARADPFHCIH